MRLIFMQLKLAQWAKRLPFHWKLLLGAEAVVTVGLLLQRRDLQVRYRQAKDKEQKDYLKDNNKWKPTRAVIRVMEHRNKLSNHPYPYPYPYPGVEIFEET